MRVWVLGSEGGCEGVSEVSCEGVCEEGHGISTQGHLQGKSLQNGSFQNTLDIINSQTDLGENIT